MASPALTPAVLRDELQRALGGLGDELARVTRDAVRGELHALRGPASCGQQAQPNAGMNNAVQAPRATRGRVADGSVIIPRDAGDDEDGTSALRRDLDQTLKMFRRRKSYRVPSVRLTQNESLLLRRRVAGGGDGAGGQLQAGRESQPSYAVLPQEAEPSDGRSSGQWSIDWNRDHLLECDEDDDDCGRSVNRDRRSKKLKWYSSEGRTDSEQSKLQPLGWWQRMKYGSQNFDEDMDEFDSAKPRGYLETCLRSITHFARSRHFDNCAGVMILLNAVHVGYHTDYMARHSNEVEPVVFRTISRCFCVLFTLEIAFRLCARGTFDFFFGGEASLNILDCFAVTIQVCEEIAHFVVSEFSSMLAFNAGALRIVRVLYFVRIATTTARIFHLFAELRMMIVSIAASIRYLMWTIFLILLLTYMFAVFCTRVATDRKVLLLSPADEHEREKLVYYYGSLGCTVMSLYQAVSEGIHWAKVMEPLSGGSPWVAVIFTLYISFALFALMNIVTGVFVESAINTAETEKKQALMGQMYKLFREADSDNSGTISWDEFQAHLESPQMQVFLHAIDLDQDEARALFHLLDVEDTGEIDAELIVTSCMRLHGAAKAIELAAFMHEFRRSQRTWMAHADHVERTLNRICTAVHAMPLSSHHRRGRDDLIGEILPRKMQAAVRIA